MTVKKQALATITRIYLNWVIITKNQDKRLSTGIQFRFRNLFHGKKWGNRNFICQNYLVLLLPGKNKISKTKETAEWTCPVCKIDVHLYASIVCDGCLIECARTILNMLASKRHQNPARTGYAEDVLTFTNYSSTLDIRVITSIHYVFFLQC